MIDMLLKAGADPKANLPGGQTILMTAARTGNADAVKLLLAHGGDPNAGAKPQSASQPAQQNQQRPQ